MISLSITSPIAIPLPNYEEPMTKEVETETDSTLLGLFNYTYLPYYIKNITILESTIQEHSNQIQ